MDLPWDTADRLHFHMQHGSLPRCRAVRGIIIRGDMNSARWMPRKILSVGRRITNIFQR